MKDTSKKEFQFVKDVAHLHQLEKEYFRLQIDLDSKYQELRQWRMLMTIHYPQYKGENI